MPVTRQTLLTDALGSVRGVTDDSGALVGTADYTVFGGVHTQSGQSSAFGFTGELFTPQTNLLHLRARDLNPSLGRFLSADSVQPNATGTQGYNLYAYVANNPTRWLDPSGHSVSEQGSLIASGLAPMMAIVMVLAMSGSSGMGAIITWTSVFAMATFATAALLLYCAITPGCMDALADYQGYLGNLGSLGSAVASYSLATLQYAAGSYPAGPSLGFGEPALPFVYTPVNHQQPTLPPFPLDSHPPLGNPNGVLVPTLPNQQLPGSPLPAEQAPGLHDTPLAGALEGPVTGGGVIGGDPSFKDQFLLLLSSLTSIGVPGRGVGVREVKGTQQDAEALFNTLAAGAIVTSHPSIPGGLVVELPNGLGYIGYRPYSKSGPPTIDVNVPSLPGLRKIKFLP